MGGPLGLRGAGVAAVIVAVALAAAPSAAAGVEIRAGVVTVDSVSGLITASGGVVISDGTATVRAARAVVDRKTGVATLGGGVVATYPDGDLRASQVRLRLREFSVIEEARAEQATLRGPAGTLRAGVVVAFLTGRVATASGAPAFTSARGVVLTGREMRYDARTRLVTVEGDARVRARDATIRGDRLLGEPARDVATLQGHVDGTFSEIHGRAASATLRAAEQVAVLEGDVVLTRPDGTLWASRVTVYYGQHRVVAEGTTKVLIEQPDK